MKITKKIGSLSNPLVKEVLQLEKSRKRKESGRFVAEGIRELLMALRHGYQAEVLLYNEEEFDGDIIKRQFGEFAAQIGEMVAANKAVFAKVAYRESGAGVVGILQAREANFDSLVLKKHPLVLVLEGVEKPGNLGAMLRTANAAGVDAVLVCDPLADIYNPNCIRASLGAVFATPVLSCTSAQAIRWLQKKQLPIYVTYLEAAIPHYDADLRGAAALVLGSEALGISEEWLQAATQNIIIPMQGEVDSLNVSNAAAIVLFEALRQRGG